MVYPSIVVAFSNLRTRRAPLVSTSYVLVETYEAFAFDPHFEQEGFSLVD